MSDNKFPRPSKGIIEVCEDSPLAISFFFDWEIRDWCEKVRKRLEKADARNHPEWDEMDSEQAAQKCIVDLLEMLKC